jgi:hypothetical protein
MKPKPLSALNHFTVPVAINPRPLSVCHDATYRADREPTGPAPSRRQALVLALQS